MGFSRQEYWSHGLNLRLLCLLHCRQIRWLALRARGFIEEALWPERPERKICLRQGRLGRAEKRTQKMRKRQEETVRSLAGLWPGTGVLSDGARHGPPHGWRGWGSLVGSIKVWEQGSGISAQLMWHKWQMWERPETWWLIVYYSLDCQRKTEEDLNVLVWNGLQDTVLESKSTEQCASVCLYVY